MQLFKFDKFCTNVTYLLLLKASVKLTVLVKKERKIEKKKETKEKKQFSKNLAAYKDT